MESQMNFLELTTEKLNVGDISDLVANDGCGATSLFIGTTRDNFEGKKVLTLEYVAYEPMALKMMATICDNIRHKWNEVQKVAIYHRLGVVPVKEASVVIAVSSPHRKASLEAVQYAIEELKKSVPIWKKEQYETDDFAWKENKECADGKIRRMKNIKLEFETCPISIEQLPQNLIQIGADEEEIKRRISCFVEKKREEIDLNNIMDFILVDNKKADENPGNGEKTSCARTNSIVIKQVDSKGHLRVRRVKNRCGPQVKPDYTQALDKLMKNDPDSEINIKKEILSLNSNSDSYEMPTGLKERLQNVEAYLNLKVPNPQHIYERIKAIENRILYLESISPEYKHFLLDKVAFNQDVPQTCKKRIYSLEDLNAFIDDLKTGIENEDVKPADYAV